MCDGWGANQFLSEVEFIESTLSHYLTDECSHTLDQAKLLLQERIDAAAEADEPAALSSQAAEEERRDTIRQWKASTSLMFAAFTPMRIRKKKEA